MPSTMDQMAFGFPTGSASSLEDLEAVRETARHCRNCPLWENATQTVFGEGPVPAPLMLIGEQPGDKEDRAGKPFVGPAGQRLDQALEDAGVDRKKIYVTNAVKHFKFVPRGKVRLHQKPVSVEIKACHPWLDRELEFVQPKLVVAMGATAAQSLFGKAMPINKNRSRLIDLGASKALVTIHPSLLLRMLDKGDAEMEYARFVSDLRLTLPFLS